MQEDYRNGQHKREVILSHTRVRGTKLGRPKGSRESIGIHRERLLVYLTNGDRSKAELSD
jgi:hypothetical protein